MESATSKEGQMKSLMLLWQTWAEEFAHICGTSTTRDLETLAGRVEHEGYSFYAITLPAFCKDFERSLDQGQVTRNLFQGFSWKGGLPKFLRGFLEQVFDEQSGSILDDPNIEAIQAVRQLTLLYSKVKALPNQRRRDAAIEGYVACENEVRGYNSRRSPILDDRFRRISNILLGRALSRANQKLYEEQGGPVGDCDPDWPYVLPKHGPGATAERISGNGKFDQLEWTSRLDAVFPWEDYAIPSQREEYLALYDRVDFREPGQERPQRVVLVPKTWKTPRIIAIEPSYLQYIQQGLAAILVPAIEGDPLIGGMIGFKDQHVNNALAQIGSINGSLATLDLSEASDRVSHQLVQILLERQPYLREAVDACRSRSADVPGVGEIPLAKFASMGSALTFPIEAMVFLAIVFVSIEKELGYELTVEDIKSFHGQVRVYGDDIIVPAHHVSAVVAGLESFGLKVNASKSFWTGKFRESCGKEYYHGHDVSVVRVRELDFTNPAEPRIPSRRQHARAIESLTSTRNQSYLAGYWHVAKWLDDRISRALSGLYPVVSVTSQYPGGVAGPRSQLLGRWSFLAPQAERFRLDHQSPEVLGWVATDEDTISMASEIGALMKILSTSGRYIDPERRSDLLGDLFPSNQREDHLEYAGRANEARRKLTRKWVTPF
nr:MAG: hypothetical protein 3 [Leviviridae sp.]